jgi:hypothetical protein
MIDSQSLYSKIYFLGEHTSKGRDNLWKIKGGRLFVSSF